MSAWWASMAPRERLLIAVAGILTVVIVGWQFVLVPTMAARAEAEVRLNEADRSVARIQERYGLQRALGAAAPTNARPTSASIEDFKAAVTGTAGNVGLSIARLQGNDSTSVRLIFEDVEPRLIFVWLESVQANQSGQVTRFNMEQAGGGLVRASVDLVPGGR
jgi:type II secretory pathway component PulM